MKRLCTTIAALALLSSCGIAIAQDLNVREFRRYVDARAVTTADRLTWYAGESVGYTILSRRGTNVVEIPAGCVPVWTVLDAETNAFVVTTGTVVSATNGEVRFWLQAPDANLPDGSYLSYATVYQGTNRVGVLDRATVSVSWRPGDDFTATEPISNVLDQVIGWWADYNDEIADAVAAEALLRSYVEAALADRIGLEETNRATAVATVQSNLVAASNALHSADTNEAALRIAGDATLGDRIGLEETNRASGVATVQSNVVAASNALHSADTNEAALRIAGDSTLADRIGLEETNRASGVATVQSNLVAASNALHSADTNEAALRISGDATLGDRIGLEETNRATAVETVQSNVVAASNALHSADTNEAALRVAGDATLADRVGLEETNRAAAVSAITPETIGAVRQYSAIDDRYIKLGVTNSATGSGYLQLWSAGSGRWTYIYPYGTNIYDISSEGFSPLWQMPKGTNPAVWLGRVLNAGGGSFSAPPSWAVDFTPSYLRPITTTNGNIGYYRGNAHGKDVTTATNSTSYGGFAVSALEPQSAYAFAQFTVPAGMNSPTQLTWAVSSTETTSPLVFTFQSGTAAQAWTGTVGAANTRAVVAMPTAGTWLAAVTNGQRVIVRVAANFAATNLNNVAWRLVDESAGIVLWK